MVPAGLWQVVTWLHVICLGKRIACGDEMTTTATRVRGGRQVFTGRYRYELGTVNL